MWVELFTSWAMQRAKYLGSKKISNAMNRDTVAISGMIGSNHWVAQTQIKPGERSRLERKCVECGFQSSFICIKCGMQIGGQPFFCDPLKAKCFWTLHPNLVIPEDTLAIIENLREKREEKREKKRKRSVTKKLKLKNQRKRKKTEEKSNRQN